MNTEIKKLPVVRLTVDIPIAEATTLSMISISQRTTITETLRRAITTAYELEIRRQAGCRLLLEKQGKITELIWKQ